MIKQLVSNVGISGQKSKVFNGLLTSRSMRHLPSMMARSYATGESLMTVFGLHTQRKDDSQHYFTYVCRCMYTCVDIDNTYGYLSVVFYVQVFV